MKRTHCILTEDIWKALLYSSPAAAHFDFGTGSHGGRDRYGASQTNRRQAMKQSSGMWRDREICPMRTRTVRQLRKKAPSKARVLKSVLIDSDILMKSRVPKTQRFSPNDD